MLKFISTADILRSAKRVTRPKLLLADDSVTIRKVVELTFADEGIDVTTVADGGAAMAKFVEVQPDIVLVDVGLPGTNGYHICEMIKADESTSHIPVLLLVGSFEPFDQDAAEKSGADGFLTKPFHSIRDLVNRVHELLGTQGEPLADDVIDFETTISDNDTSDTEDITDLYERSFAETVPIENYETVPAFTSDDTFPDEISTEEPANEQLAADQGASSEKDHSNDDHTSATEANEERVDGSHHSVDEWLDDEMIETVSSADPAEVRAAESEAVKAVAHYEEAPAAAVDIEPIKEFDWSPAAIVTAADEKEIGAAAGFGSSFDHDEPVTSSAPAHDAHITEELPDPKTDEMPEVSREQADGHFSAEPVSETVNEPPTVEQTSETQPIPELSPEVIEVIVRRVVERLSDRAVREVAQEAVPRIAEKLMREALEEDRNR